MTATDPSLLLVKSSLNGQNTADQRKTPMNPSTCVSYILGMNHKRHSEADVTFSLATITNVQMP